MVAVNTLLPFLLSLEISRHGGAHAEIGAVDRLDNCKELVEKKECLKNPDKMKKDCPISCRKWQASMNRVVHTTVDETKHPSFFTLSAKNSTGETMNFAALDGYLTIVANTMKTCTPGVTESVLASMEHLHDVWPYTLEILVFVFDNPEFSATAASELGLLDCESHEKAVKKEGRRIHVMEEVTLNGPETHPVYKYLKDQFDLEEEDGLTTEFATFFIISPDGDKIEANIAASPELLKHSIATHLEQDL